MIEITGVADPDTDVDRIRIRDRHHPFEGKIVLVGLGDRGQHRLTIELEIDLIEIGAMKDEDEIRPRRIRDLLLQIVDENQPINASHIPQPRTAMIDTRRGGTEMATMDRHQLHGVSQQKIKRPSGNGN